MIGPLYADDLQLNMGDLKEMLKLSDYYQKLKKNSKQKIQDLSEKRILVLV